MPAHDKRTMLATEVNPELTEIWEVYARAQHHRTMTGSQRFSISDHWNRRSALKESTNTFLEQMRHQIDDMQLLEPLGKGGMGVVYLARQLSMGREVAVKLLREDKRGEEQSQKLLDEARITAALDHPNVIPIYSLGVDPSNDQSPMYVMKRVEGVNWKQVLREQADLPTLLDTQDDRLDANLDILESVCRAVHFAHSKGIVHLDLKTDNVMLGHFGEVYVVDWGISASFAPLTDSPESLALPHTLDLTHPRGTPGFMAPEVAAAAGDLIGPHTDIYLLGGILHYILTGKTRHHGKDIYSVLNMAYLSPPFSYDTSIPPILAEICNKAMARQPEERYTSAEALRQAIARFRQQREGVVMLQRARQTLTDLVKHSKVSADKVMTSYIYQKYGEINFALERARQLGIPHTEGVQGAALRAVFDVELDKGNATAARELLGQASQWSSQDAHRVSMLEELESKLAEREAWMKHMEVEQGEHDASISQRTRGFILLGLTLALAGVASLSKVLVNQGVLPNTAEMMILIKGVNTLLAIALALMAPRFMKFNLVNKRMFMTLALAMGGGLVVRTLALLQGVAEHIVLGMETTVALLCVCMLSIFVERKLLLATPFFIISILCSQWIPTRAWEMMILWNMSGLIFMGGLWILLKKRRAKRSTSLEG